MPFDKPFSACQIYAIIHNTKQQAWEIDIGHTCATVSPLARNGCFYTADCTVVIGIFFFHTPVDEGWNDDFIIVESRHAKAKLHDFNALIKELLIQIGMVSDCQVRLCQTCLSNRAQNKPAEWIDSILSIRRLTTDCNILIHRRSSG